MDYSKGDLLRSPLLMRNFRHHSLVFWVGLIGLIFYAVGPVLLHAPELRQPELIPAYTLMIGVGHALKGNDTPDDKDK